MWGPSRYATGVMPPPERPSPLPASPSSAPERTQAPEPTPGAIGRLVRAIRGLPPAAPWRGAGWGVTALTVSYFLLAVRRVYGDGWPRTLVKSAGVLVGYAVALYLVIFVNTMLAILRA